jgi:uncharacterized protein
LEEEIIFQGHKNILSLHSRTIEITKDSVLTKNGDCIVGVSANKACDDLDPALKQKFNILGLGNNHLQVTHKHDIVLRKSNYVDPRTLIVSCDKSAIDIPRYLIKALTDPETKGLLRVRLE